MSSTAWLYRDLILPAMLLILGLFLMKKTPANDATTFGIRTKTSKMSDAAWRYEHYICSRIWAVGGLVMILLFLLLKYIPLPFSADDLAMFNTDVGIVFMLASIPITDKIVQKKYGKPKNNRWSRWQGGKNPFGNK